MKYINADDIPYVKRDGEWMTYKCVIEGQPSADVVEVESLKTYLLNLMSDIPLTDYIKDDYDMGFLDALRIIHTHLGGADVRGEA